MLSEQNITIHNACRHQKIVRMRYGFSKLIKTHFEWRKKCQNVLWLFLVLPQSMVGSFLNHNAYYAWILSLYYLKGKHRRTLLETFRGLKYFSPAVITKIYCYSITYLKYFKEKIRLEIQIILIVSWLWVGRRRGELDFL